CGWRNVWARWGMFGGEIALGSGLISEKREKMMSHENAGRNFLRVGHTYENAGRSFLRVAVGVEGQVVIFYVLKGCLSQPRGFRLGQAQRLENAGLQRFSLSVVPTLSQPCPNLKSSFS